jgi:hypothetical protein
MQTENEATNAAYARASQHARKIAQQAAETAAGKEHDPDRAIIAFDRAWELVYGTAYQNAFDQFLPQEYKRLADEERLRRAEGESEALIIENND